MEGREHVSTNIMPADGAINDGRPGEPECNLGPDNGGNHCMATPDDDLFISVSGRNPTNNQSDAFQVVNEQGINDNGDDVLSASLRQRIVPCEVGHHVNENSGYTSGGIEDNVNTPKQQEREIFNSATCSVMASTQQISSHHNIGQRNKVDDNNSIDAHATIAETLSSKVVQSLEQEYGFNLPFPTQQHLQTYQEPGPSSLSLVSAHTPQQYRENSPSILRVTPPEIQQSRTYAPENVIAVENETSFPKASSGVYFVNPQTNSAPDQIDDVCAAVGINQNSNLVDFFSSLELQSRWVGDIPRVQPTDNEDRLDHQKALRIASILNDLAFNSDTEDFLPSDADDLWTSDLEDADVDLHDTDPNRGHGAVHPTGGKWKPGQGPPGKKRGKSLPSSSGQQSQGKWKPSGKLDAMRKAKAKPMVKSRGKRMSAKLKAMKKARRADLVEEEVKWKPGERLRDRSSFRKVWKEEGKRGGKKTKEDRAHQTLRNEEGESPRSAKDCGDPGLKKRQVAQEDLPPEMREDAGSEGEEEVVPLDFICRTCNVKLSSQGHFIRHIKSQEHIKRLTVKVTPAVPCHEASACNRETSNEGIFEGTHIEEKTLVEAESAARNDSTQHCDPSVRTQDSISECDKKLGSSTAEKKEDTRHPEVECTICCKSFSLKYLFARHLATNSHLQRASACPQKMLLDESVQVLLLRQSRVQCLVCSFFGTDRKFLLQHMATKEHTERVDTLLGPLLCVRCKFACRSNEEMQEHLQGQSHVQLTEASGRPCVIKESRSRIPCPSCSVIVQSVNRLKAHLKICKGTPRQPKGEKREPVCSYCGRLFSTLYAMTIHIRRKHTKDKPFRCDWCDVAFADRHSLGVHQLSITHLEHTAIVLPPLVPAEVEEPQKKRGKRFKCRHCDFSAKIYSALRPHYYAHHAAAELECEVCQAKFSSAEEQRKHDKTLRHRKMVNAQNYEFSCHECGKVCKNEQSLKIHELSHSHPVSEKQLAKEQPAGIIAGISSKHLTFIESIKSLPAVHKVQCPECDQWMPRSRIYAHLRRHEGVKLFQCPYCPKSLASANTLKQHIHAHLQVKNHPCDKCDKTFLCQIKLREHVNEKHSVTPEPLAACKQCGETFPSGRLLYKHQLTHISAFKCTVQGCFYTTKYKYDLRVHMKTHSNEKNFLCNLCGFAAKRKGGLLEHMKSHTGLKKFTCEYCDYKAKTGAHLRRHMRIHIGAKPFSCPYCSFKCGSLDNLHKHIQATKKHAGLPVYPCKMCDFGTNASREFRSHLIGTHKIDTGEIGKMLTSYCGIYDKSSDPKDIPEGACALPVREVKSKPSSKEREFQAAPENELETARKTDKLAKNDLNDFDVAVQSQITESPLPFVTQCEDNGESIILTMIPPAEGPEVDAEMEDDPQVFPDIQALLKHLTQQQDIVTSVPENRDLEIQVQDKVNEELL